MPSACFVVFQASDKGYKGRIVYCPPFKVTILEIMFGCHINDFLIKSKDNSIKIGEHQIELHNLMMQVRESWKATGDYSSYDQTIPSEILFLSFQLIKSVMKLSDYESKLFDELRSYIIHGHIYHPETGVINRKRGIISGSFFTNMIDGLSNLIMIHYCDNIMGRNIKNIFVCGDDNLVCSDIPIRTNKLSSLLLKIFGVTNTIPYENVARPGSTFLGTFLGSRWYP
jgi:hypothetical protein